MPKFFCVNIAKIFPYSISHYLISHLFADSHKCLLLRPSLKHLKNSNPLIYKLFFLYFPLPKGKFAYHFTPINSERSNFNVIHSISSFLEYFSLFLMKLIFLFHIFHFVFGLTRIFLVIRSCIIEILCKIIKP